jgi:hypothetical protein
MASPFETIEASHPKQATSDKSESSHLKTLLTLRDEAGLLFVELQTTLVKETLESILERDVEEFNCMEPEGECALMEQIAKLSAISVDGPVMARALEQLGDLYESLVCYKYCFGHQSKAHFISHRKLILFC